MIRQVHTMAFEDFTRLAKKKPNLETLIKFFIFSSSLRYYL